MRISFLFVFLFSFNCSETLCAQEKNKVSGYLTIKQNEYDILDDISKNVALYLGVTEKVKKYKDSLYLAYRYPLSGAPESEFIVMSNPIRDKHGKIVENYIHIQMSYKLPAVLKTDAAQNKLLFINNKLMGQYSHPNTILCTKDYLYFRDSIYMPSNKPIPARTFFNTLAVSSYFWTEYYKILQKNFNMPKEKIVPPFQEEKKTVKSKKMNYPPSLRHLVE